MTPETLADCLNRLIQPESRTLVRASDHDWAIVEYRSTGRLQQHAIRVGDATYTADVPEVAPHVTATAPTLEALAAQHGRAKPDPAGDWAATHARDHAEARDRDAELATLLTETLTARLADAAAAATPLSPTARAKCSNCSGRGGGTGSHCPCKDRGAHYLGVIADPGDLITDSPSQPPEPASDPAPDPGCPKCRGTGITAWTCQPCHGTGHAAACHDWHVTGPSGTMRVRMDAAALLRNGDARPRVRVHSTSTAASVAVELDLAPLITRINDTVAAGQPTWLRQRNHFSDWPTSTAIGFTLALTPAGQPPAPYARYSRADQPFRYALDQRRRDPATQRDPRWVDLAHLDEILPTGKALLAALRGGLAGNPWLHDEHDAVGYRLGPDKLVEAVDKTAVVKLPSTTLLDDMIAQAGHANGFAIGLGTDFIATGQTGPTAYLLDHDNAALAQIGLAYDWHQAIAEAHAGLPAAITQARKAGYGDR